MPMTSTEMIKLLKKNGFVQIVGGKGSHKKFYNRVPANQLLFLIINKNLVKVWSIEF